MIYKGFEANVHISVEDNLLYGTIANINDTISFQGNTVGELRKAFENAVEDYIELCKRLDK